MEARDLIGTWKGLGHAEFDGDRLTLGMPPEPDGAIGRVRRQRMRSDIYLSAEGSQSAICGKAVSKIKSTQTTPT